MNWISSQAEWVRIVYVMGCDEGFCHLLPQFYKSASQMTCFFNKV